jgi:sarcosine oxidase subunit gamma
VADILGNHHPDLSGATGPGVTLAERTGFEMVQVSARPATSDEVSGVLTEVLGVRPPQQPNAVANRGQIKILWLGPDRWLIVRQAESQQVLALELGARLSLDTASVVEVGAGRCVLALSGTHARDVLAKYLPLDLSEAKFPAGRCAQSAMAHIGVLVHSEGEGAFEIFVSRSFERSLWEMLTDAALEFRLEARRRDLGGRSRGNG